jgi:hypothetical protein
MLVFESDSPNAIKGGVTGAHSNIYVRDLGSGKLRLVSRNGGKKGNAGSRNPDISGNGRFVFFETEATNLVPGGDANGAEDDVIRRGPYR